MTVTSFTDFEAILDPLSQELSQHLSQIGVPPEVVERLNKVSVHLQYLVHPSVRAIEEQLNDGIHVHKQCSLSICMARMNLNNFFYEFLCPKS
jgi:hypothetical protein